MIQRELLDKAQNALRLIDDKRSELDVMERFLKEQSDLSPVDAFLFRSKEETERNIEFLNRWIDRLITHYNKIIAQLLINRLKKEHYDKRIQHTRNGLDKVQHAATHTPGQRQGAVLR